MIRIMMKKMRLIVMMILIMWVTIVVIIIMMKIKCPQFEVNPWAFKLLENGFLKFLSLWVKYVFICPTQFLCKKKNNYK